MKEPIPFGRPVIGAEEKAAVADVLESPMLVHGPRVKEFEAAFAEATGAAHAVAVGSCTAGMHLVWMALGLGPGDEVVVPAETHVATAHAVEAVGAKAVFVDSSPTDGNLDTRRLADAITARTRAIAVVHYLGEPVDMPAVMEVARSHGLFVLEDCALALGTTLDGTHAGLLGHAGVFSFYPVKHITTGEGGMVISRDRDLIERVGRQRAFGVDRTVDERTQAGIYDVTMLGLNYRMGEVQGALGLAQLKRLPHFLERRRENSIALDEALTGIHGVHLLPASDDKRRRSSWYCRSAVLDPDLGARRAEIAAAMEKRGVGTSVYYPAPVPLLSHYKTRGPHRREDFPVAARLSWEAIALPVGPHLQPRDMQSISRALAEAVKEVTN